MPVASWQRGWVKPRQIKSLLENCLNDGIKWPGERGVYIVTGKRWIGWPKKSSEIWYIGISRGKSNRLCTRIGDLIADVHGFFQTQNGHHSGGQTIWHKCYEEDIHPGELWLSWKKWVRDPEGKETELLTILGPTYCNKHKNKVSGQKVK